MENQIAIKALLYTERNSNEILVFEFYESIKKQPYYRPIGGTVEFGETTSDALKREVMEETGENIDIKKLLLVTENIFIFNGKLCQEIAFIYLGEFTNKNFLQENEFWITESNGKQFKCKWIEKALFKNQSLFLVPKQLLDHI